MSTTAHSKNESKDKPSWPPDSIPLTYFQQVINLPLLKSRKHSVPKEPTWKTDTCKCSIRSEDMLGRKDAIVYTVKNSKKLDDSLRLLYGHYNNCFRKDVLIFHNGDISKVEQDQIRSKHGPEIQFHVLASNGPWWRFPKGLNITDKSNWVQYPQLGVGYRHMMRWYSVLIYEYLAKLGYKWYMRLDDDSKILSCLKYDPFKFLEDNGHEYGYRLATFDASNVAVGLAELSKQYLKANKKEPPYELLAHFKNGKMSTWTWDLMGHYSNFLISKISFWRSPQVQKWLHVVDSSGIQYTNRVGDLLVQSITLLMFMPSAKIHRFTDWAYSHFTLTESGRCSWGGLVTTKSQPKVEAKAMLDWAYNIDSYYALKTEAGEHMFFCELMVLPMNDYPGF